MPDILVRHASDNSVIQRFLDLGNGSFAMAVAQIPVIGAAGYSVGGCAAAQCLGQRG